MCPPNLFLQASMNAHPLVFFVLDECLVEVPVDYDECMNVK